MTHLLARVRFVGLGLMTIVAFAVVACSTAATASYRYTKSETSWLVTDDAHRYGVIVPSVREIWIGTDGSGRLKEERGDPKFLGDASRAEWASSNPLPSNTDALFRPGELSMVNTDGLSTDVATLRTQLLQGKGEHEKNAQVILTNALAYLRETVPQPILARAIIEVVRGTPGIEEESGIADANGRRGASFSLVVESGDASTKRAVRSRLLMIVDATSGTLLEEQRILVDIDPAIDAGPGTVFGRATYVAGGITNATTEQP